MRSWPFEREHAGGQMQPGRQLGCVSASLALVPEPWNGFSSRDPQPESVGQESGEGSDQAFRHGGSVILPGLSRVEAGFGRSCG